MAQRTHTLYRFFGEGDELLYIGITVNAPARFGQHKSDKPWWSEVARIELETHPSRRAVLDAERDAIVAEKPRYNITHNPLAAHRLDVAGGYGPDLPGVGRLYGPFGPDHEPGSWEVHAASSWVARAIRAYMQASEEEFAPTCGMDVLFGYGWTDAQRSTFGDLTVARLVDVFAGWYAGEPYEELPADLGILGSEAMTPIDRHILNLLQTGWPAPEGVQTPTYYDYLHGRWQSLLPPCRGCACEPELLPGLIDDWSAVA